LTSGWKEWRRVLLDNNVYKGFLCLKRRRKRRRGA
jgi:hypothetical protein